jgi:hypothetical protein
MVINIPPISTRALLPEAVSLVAKGMSYFLVMPMAWARFIPATVIWAPESPWQVFVLTCL